MVAQETLIHKLPNNKGIILPEIRRHFARVQEEQGLKGRVLADIILRRTEEGLEVKYLFKEPQP